MTNYQEIAQKRQENFNKILLALENSVEANQELIRQFNNQFNKFSNLIESENIVVSQQDLLVSMGLSTMINSQAYVNQTLRAIYIQLGRLASVNEDELIQQKYQTQLLNTIRKQLK